MIKLIVRVLVTWLLKLRYRVETRGLEAIAERGVRGVLFLPNHPALIDPLLVLSRLYRRFQPRPLASEDELDIPVVRWLVKVFGVRTVPGLSSMHGLAAARRVRSAIDACAEGLRRGENILLYPAGRIYRSRFEDLGSHAAVQRILKQAPDARVVLVRTRGLWGSSFGFADNTYPEFFPILKRHLLTLLKNLIFFTPRRHVTIELDEPDDLPRGGARQKINAYLEAFYNQDAPPAWCVPYSRWSGERPHEFPDPDLSDAEPDAAVSPSVTTSETQHPPC